MPPHVDPPKRKAVIQEAAKEAQRPEHAIRDAIAHYYLVGTPYLHYDWDWDALVDNYLTLEDLVKFVLKQAALEYYKTPKA